MVTVHREAGFRFVIYLDDHEPAHVHVYGDGSAKIALSIGGGPPELIQASGMKASDLRKAMRIVAENGHVFLKHWIDAHG